MFGGNFAPADWRFCDGSLLSIAENDVLFSLIGTTYGGDGQTTFALPDLRGRLPVHQGDGKVMGQSLGQESVTLTAAQLPSHRHVAQADTNPGTSSNAAGNVWAASANTAMSQFAAPTSGIVSMGAMTGSVGGNQPHENMPPFLCVSFIISLFGIYPPR